MTGTKVDLRGLIFGQLTVVEFSVSKKYCGVFRRFWKCICSCGNETEALGISLSYGKTKSCGCADIKRKTTHGLSKTPEYRVWAGIIQRCCNKNNARFSDYGGRGIVVCSEWFSFENFINDVGCRPSEDHSIDRKDNNKGYCKSNCKWSTRSEQQRNKRPINTYSLQGGQHVNNRM